MSRFWVAEGARKHRENMSFFVAKPYGPGLKTRLRNKKRHIFRCFLAPFSTQNLDVWASLPGFAPCSVFGLRSAFCVCASLLFASPCSVCSCVPSPCPSASLCSVCSACGLCLSQCPCSTPAPAQRAKMRNPAIPRALQVTIMIIAVAVQSRWSMANSVETQRDRHRVAIAGELTEMPAHYQGSSHASPWQNQEHWRVMNIQLLCPCRISQLANRQNE